MQFVWPFEADHRIAFLSADYQEVIVARTARDYVWLMAREPEISPTRYGFFQRKIADMGYDVRQLRRHPQRWPEAQPRPSLED